MKQAIKGSRTLTELEDKYTPTEKLVKQRKLTVYEEVELVRKLGWDRFRQRVGYILLALAVGLVGLSLVRPDQAETAIGVLKDIVVVVAGVGIYRQTTDATK